MNLRLYRERAKIKPYEAAVAMSVSPMTISRWELGYTEPTTSQFYKLCSLYGVTDSEAIELIKHCSRREAI